ncbi:MAG TPA: hypothetical protein VHD56_20105 [Tepidisphaeraceae bacterium]|nr:hypothetical protein [Tepidisphaeraceae bacterium]
MPELADVIDCSQPAFINKGIPMRQNRAIIFFAIIIAFLMTLYPPWRMKESLGANGLYGPDYAGGYAFFMSPPNERSAYGRKQLSVVAEIDIERLIISYAGVALAAFAATIVRVWIVEIISEGIVIQSIRSRGSQMVERITGHEPASQSTAQQPPARKVA